jgi:poly-gamma-glutamate capsule biosynthesis protein CapA/YwtB (metallophosphatase superfamily)
VKLALAGDTMLGRKVAEALLERGPGSLFAPELVEVAREADLFVLNLECCISERGEPHPRKTFCFRAPPVAAEALAMLGVDCVTLANNHALDYGPDALLDTFEHLTRVGIRWVGAGPDRERARAPVVLGSDGFRLGVLGVTDHPAEFAAGPSRSGVAFADLWKQMTPDWLLDGIRGLDADAVLVTPHWGPNMVAEPVPHVRPAASDLLDAGASLVAGHSAHVFHGAGPRVLYDLGDFLDDYRVDPVLRNDLGLFFLVTFAGPHPVKLEAVPLKLEYCQTRLARGEDAAWIAERFRAACAALGTEVDEVGGRLVVAWAS